MVYTWLVKVERGTVGVGADWKDWLDVVSHELDDDWSDHVLNDLILCFTDRDVGLRDDRELWDFVLNDELVVDVSDDCIKVQNDIVHLLRRKGLFEHRRERWKRLMSIALVVAGWKAWHHVATA